MPEKEFVKAGAILSGLDKALITANYPNMPVEESAALLATEWVEQFLSGQNRPSKPLESTPADGAKSAHVVTPTSPGRKAGGFLGS